MKTNKLARQTISMLYLIQYSISRVNNYTATGFNWRSTRTNQANGSLCLSDALSERVSDLLSDKKYASEDGLAYWALSEILGVNEYKVLNEPKTYQEALFAINNAILLFEQDI